MTTGVTDFIKIGEVRQEIDSTYPNPGEDATGELAVSNNGYSHRLVGHAFEFLCRALLYRRCDEILRPWSRFGEYRRQTDGEVPWIGVERYDGMKWEDHPNISSQEEWEALQDERPVWERERSAVQWTEDEELTRVVNQYIETGMNTDGVVRAALVNAGWKPDETVQSWIDRAAFADDILDEMSELFELVREASWTCGETVIEKPQFGNHRYVLPGEGDFIVDDLLVDIKTTERRAFTNAFWRQLLLYYVLTDVQRVLYNERDGDEDHSSSVEYPEINRVGIYFARYGELQTVEIDSVIDDRERYEEFRAWIVDRGIEENRHAQKNYERVRGSLTEPYDYKRQQTFSDF
jgi:hypothetical protein